MEKTLILVVEDDEDIQKINSTFLRGQGYEVICAGNLKEAFTAVEKQNPGLIILDERLPDGSGVEFCEAIREKTDVPIIFLTCMDAEEDKVRGLMAGGDDYITKPYSLSELAARVHALLRRAERSGERFYDYPPLRLDTLTNRAYLDGNDVLLTPREFQILLLLVKNIGKPITITELYNTLWGQPPEKGVKTILVHIHAIRRKIETDKHSRIQIKTVRKAGYCFEYEDI